RQRQEHRRHEGDFRVGGRAPRRQRPPRRHLRRLPPALSTDSHDHDGGDARRAPVGDWRRYRVGTAAAPRHHHHRRADRQPGSHALYDARGLSLFRPAAALAEAAIGKRMANRGPTWGRLMRRIAALALALSTASCTVGPTYHRPPIAGVPAFTEAPPAGWKEAEPNEGIPRGRWWEMYNDPQLNALESRVELSNQNVIAAMARYREARDQ